MGDANCLEEFRSRSVVITSQVQEPWQNLSRKRTVSVGRIVGSGKGVAAHSARLSSFVLHIIAKVTYLLENHSPIEQNRRSTTAHIVPVSADRAGLLTSAFGHPVGWPVSMSETAMLRIKDDLQQIQSGVVKQV